MLSFKKFLEESEVLAKVKNIPHEDNWLDDTHYKSYGNKPEEVKTSDLGMKMHSDLPHDNSQRKGEYKYKNSALQRVPLDKMHYSQRSVNRGKLEHMMKHYHPHHTDFHPEDGVLSKHEAPEVFKHVDGNYSTSDHHRLIASHLRGDTHAIARVYELKKNSDGSVSQKKSKSDFKRSDWDK